MTKNTPASIDWAPLRIIAHCAPNVRQRRTPVISWANPAADAQIPNTASTAFMLNCKATATAIAATRLTAILNACVGFALRPPLP